MAPRVSDATPPPADPPAILGSTTPRLWTPPWVDGPPGPCGCGCALTPDTSYGFRAVRFAEHGLRLPPDPWQRWLAIHAGELLPDGRPRFRLVIVIVARQNGKSTIFIMLVPYWQFVEAQPMTLLVSTKIDYARKLWEKAVRLAERAAGRDDDDGQAIADLIPRRRNGALDWTRATNGEQESWTTEDAYAKIAAGNGDAGRSLSVNRLGVDEARQQYDYEMWEAAEPTMSAIADSQGWLLSNAGGQRSILLNDLRDEALRYIERGEGDGRVGLFEWSCSPNADPEDLHELARANPNLGHRIDAATLLAKARTAKRKGGDTLAKFKMNYMCITVKAHDPAFDFDRWKLPAVEGGCFDPGTLDGVRDRLACVVDVSPDERHATLLAGALLSDGRVRVEAVRAWDGDRCLADVRRDLPSQLAKIKPKVFGWFPNGPAAVLTAELRERKGRTVWPPAGVVVEEIRGETAAACMALASLIEAGQIAQSGDPLLNDHIAGAERLYRGETWVLSRKGEGHVDGAYGVAGVVQLARTLPTPEPVIPIRGLVVVD